MLPARSLRRVSTTGECKAPPLAFSPTGAHHHAPVMPLLLQLRNKCTDCRHTARRPPAFPAPRRLRCREPRWAKLAIIHRLDKETSGLIVFGAR